MGTSQEKFIQLKNELESDFSIKDTEKLLNEICNVNNPDSIELLVSLLKDDFEYDEFMFSIIHCIEKFETQIYVKHILNSIPAFIYKSPRWASIIHMRILNSEKTLLAYIIEIRQNAVDAQKDAIKELLNTINKVSPEFLAKTVPLLVIL